MSAYISEISEGILGDPNNTFGIVIKMVTQNAEVLEIGCATGYMTRWLCERRGCRVTGIEINPEAAHVAQQFCAHLVVGDVEDQTVLAQVGGPFDVIVFADVLEHLFDPFTTLVRLRTFLRPTGCLVVSLPNIAHWSIRRALLRGVWEYTDRGILDRTHIRFFTLQSATTMLETAGYRVEERRQMYVFPAHWRRNFGPWLAARVQGRHMPRWFDELFAYQFIFRATVP